MTDAAGMDLRTPIGALFVLLGVLLAGYGLLTAGDTALYARAGGENINLVWGGVMLLFGAVMLGLAARAKR